MADILLVDSNPEHVRALGGLIRYRTPNHLDVVPDCVTAIRHIQSNPPDLILINVLLYCSAEFGFARALRELEGEAVRILVHVSGHVKDLTRLSIEAHGAKLVELPLEASEIREELTKPAFKPVSSGVQSVSWSRVEPNRNVTSTGTRYASNIRAVNWAVDGTHSKKPQPAAAQSASPKAATSGEATRSRPKTGEPEKAQSFSFQPLSESAEQVGEPPTFRPDGRTGLEEVRPEEVKNRRRRR